MANELTASQERELKKGINERLNLIRKMGSGRKLAHLADVENPNRQIRKSDCETAIAGLHRNGNGLATIAKVAKPGSNASEMIATMHSRPGEFADRDIAGNSGLVLKLAGAVVQAAARDYSSAAQARREIRKLIEISSSNDVPRNHSTLKTGKGKIGTVAIIKKRGADYPYEIQADGYFHSCYKDVDAAEKAFAALTA